MVSESLHVLLVELSGLADAMERVTNALKVTVGGGTIIPTNSNRWAVLTDLTNRMPRNRVILGSGNNTKGIRADTLPSL
jgi:hypothetical protein